MRSKKVHVCRICLESTEKLIRPCNCSGTQGYIHEKCLKTWILSKTKRLKNSKCEICKVKYEMKFKKGLKFAPKMCLDVKLSHILLGFVLTGLIPSLAFAVVYIVNRILEAEYLEEVFCLSSIALAICFILVLALITAVKSFTWFCFVRVVKDCEITDKQPAPDISCDVPRKIKTVCDKPIISGRVNQFHSVSGIQNMTISDE